MSYANTVPDQTQSWIWSDEHQDHYMAQLDQNGQCFYTWARNQRDSAWDENTSVVSTELPQFTIRDTGGYYERLDPAYQVQSDPRRFFRVGRMFAVLFSEAMGETAARLDSEDVTVVRYGERVFTNIRRFIVVREGRGFCYACPVSTYGGRGTLKPGLDPITHAAVYTTNSAPVELQGEDGMDKEPIAIIPNNGATLTPASRLNFALHHPIQHNVKVKDLGRVCPEDLPKLIAYWRMENGLNDE